MRALTAVLTSVGMFFAAPSFADNDVLVGTGLGAALGAVVGHQIDHNNGAWVGGAVGAVTGAAVASSNNATRYVARDSYYYNDAPQYYSNAPRRDIYVVEPEYYHRPVRPPVNVIYVDNEHGHHRRDHHHHRHHHGHHGRGDARTVVIVR